MNKHYKKIYYSGSDLMSELVGERYHMLLILNRFGIDMGFGDSTIKTVCAQYKIDLDTFLSVVNLLCSGDTSAIQIGKVSLGSLIPYLNNSHAYFRDFKLPEIREKLMNALCGNNAISVVVMRYLDEYIEDIVEHMNYEEQVVFAYINSLLSGETVHKGKIAEFCEHHQSVEAKLTELKNILIKYYNTKSTYELGSALFDIFTCEQDLVSHSQIEDYLLIPAIRNLEEI